MGAQVRFDGEREVLAPVDEVWTALHSPEVLGDVIPGCERLQPRGRDTYEAALAARVGPIADTYRGTFSIADPLPGSRLRVRVVARGRCGRIEIDLRVVLADGQLPGTTTLRYDAVTIVGGLVARLGSSALTVAGSQLTGWFFRSLDRSLGARRPARPVVVA